VEETRPNVSSAKQGVRTRQDWPTRTQRPNASSQLSSSSRRAFIGSTSPTTDLTACCLAGSFQNVMPIPSYAVRKPSDAKLFDCSLIEPFKHKCAKQSANNIAVAQNEGGQHKRASDSCEAPWSTWRGFADGRPGVFTFQLTPDCSTAPTPPCHSLRPKTMSPAFSSERFAVVLFRQDVAFAQAVRAIIATQLLLICLKVCFEGLACVAPGLLLNFSMSLSGTLWISHQGARAIFTG
jgi:hypothetical protein